MEEIIFFTFHSNCLTRVKIEFAEALFVGRKFDFVDREESGFKTSLLDEIRTKLFGHLTFEGSEKSFLVFDASLRKLPKMVNLVVNKKDLAGVEKTTDDAGAESFLTIMIKFSQRWFCRMRLRLRYWRSNTRKRLRTIRSGLGVRAIFAGKSGPRLRSGRSAGSVDGSLGGVGGHCLTVILLFTGLDDFCFVVTFIVGQRQGGGRKRIGDGGVDGDFDNDLIASEANQVVLGVEISKLVHETVSVGSTNHKAHESAGITKDGVLNFDRKLGSVLVGKDKVETIFTSLGENFDK